MSKENLKSIHDQKLIVDDVLSMDFLEFVERSFLKRVSIKEKERKKGKCRLQKAEKQGNKGIYGK